MRKYLHYVALGYRKRLSYRAALFSLVVLYAMTFSITMYFWLYVFRESAEVVRGYSFGDTFTYLFVASLIRTFVNNDLDIRLSSKIRSGSFASDLLMPLNPVLLNVSESIGTSVYMFLWGCLPIGLTVSVFMPVLPTSLRSIPLVALSLIVACIINIYINYIVGALSVWTQKVDGIVAVKGFATLILSGTLVPLEFLPRWLSTVAKWSPFSALTYLPARIYLEKTSIAGVAGALTIQALWIGILHLVATRLARHVRRRYMVFGG